MMIKTCKQSSGFSLVELLVAMVIGVIVIGGAFAMHSGSRKTQKVNEAQMDMIADARFAIDVIAYDLRHAGMWGGTNKDSLIDCKSTDAACASTSSGDIPPTTITGDCVDGWHYNLARPVFATDNSDDTPNPYSDTCIPGSGSEGYKAGTDILEIRYADSNIPGTLFSGQVYVRSNFLNGRVFVGSNQPVINSYDTDPLTQNHELHAYAYYISNHTDDEEDGIPSLRRVALVRGPSLQKQLLISGVSDLQLQFGEDVDGDLAIDRYVDPDDVTDWTQVYAAKIWLLMRSDDTQNMPAAKSFTLAGNTDTYGGDGFRYFMVSSVVNLRNVKQL